MPRNSSGTHSLPAGQPVISGTVISATTHNALTSDISTELTDSLSRSGKGPMTAALRTPDGTLAAPAHTFTNETGSGMRRNAAGDVRLTVLGVDSLNLTNAGVDVPGTLDVTGAATVGGTLGVTGLATFNGGVTTSAISAAGIVLTATGANEIDFFTNGAEAGAFLSTGNLWMGTHKIVELGTPSAATDAATKGYVDGRIRYIGSATISDANTMVTNLVYTEADTNYAILVTPSGISGAPATGSSRVRATKMTNGYRLDIEVAPGVGNSVSFDVVVMR